MFMFRFRFRLGKEREKERRRDSDRKIDRYSRYYKNTQTPTHTQSTYNNITVIERKIDR